MISDGVLSFFSSMGWDYEEGRMVFNGWEEGRTEDWSIGGGSLSSVRSWVGPMYRQCRFGIPISYHIINLNIHNHNIPGDFVFVLQRFSFFAVLFFLAAFLFVSLSRS